MYWYPVQADTGHNGVFIISVFFFFFCMRLCKKEPVLTVLDKENTLTKRETKPTFKLPYMKSNRAGYQNRSIPAYVLSIVFYALLYVLQTQLSGMLKTEYIAYL